MTTELRRYCHARVEFSIFTFLFLQKEKYHTHLALLYLEQVLKMRRDPSCSLENLNRQRYECQRKLCKVDTTDAKYILIVVYISYLDFVVNESEE